MKLLVWNSPVRIPSKEGVDLHPITQSPRDRVYCIRLFALSCTKGNEKKADVVEHYGGVFDHVGLLVNGPPGMAGLPFI
jgi:hypothetical protein